MPASYDGKNYISYSDLSTVQTAYAAVDFLRVAEPYLVTEMFGQAHELPTNETQTMAFQRYEALDDTPKYLTEGVTPQSDTLSKTKVTCTLKQMGNWIGLTDVVADTHEDPILKIAIERLGQQAARMIETMRFDILKAGTNVFYANGTSRSDVNTPMTLTLQRKVVRALMNQLADRITKRVASTPNFNTESIAPAYVAVCHPNCLSDIREMKGFIDAKDYGSVSAWPTEIGSVEDVRYLYTTMFTPWEDAGGAKGGSGTEMLSTSGTDADVYPIIFFGQDAYGIVPLKGKASVAPMVLNPNVARGGDPMGQRGSVAWKTMQTCVILNQAWMARAEVAVTE